MCLVTFAHDVGEYVLALGANRDEYLARPAIAAQFWDDAPDVFGGRDARSGGTWLAMSTLGRFAAVTNVRNVRAGRGSRSRGELCGAFVLDRGDPVAWANALVRGRAGHAAFNLLLHDGRAMVYATDVSERVAVVAPGIHGLSNAGLDDGWPKVERARRALGEALERDAAHLVERTFEILRDERGARDEELPDTGYGAEIERPLAPIFVRTPDYGTRCSTVLVWHRDGRVLFEERSFGPSGDEVGAVKRELTVPAIRTA